MEDNWKHRSEGMRCNTCMFFAKKAKNGTDPQSVQQIGRCRKHAPTMSGFPVVYPMDWCGDHKLDETKI